MTIRADQSRLAHFYDLLDGFEEGDPIELVSDDLQFEMMFPAADGIPSERFHGGKLDFERFRAEVRARGARFEHSETQRRHNIDTLTFVDGLELIVGRALGGRRNGTLLTAARADTDGKLRRYALVMSSEVHFSNPSVRVEPPPDLLAQYFDRVDGISLDEPLDLLSDDFRFEMVFPGIEGPPDERISRDKEDFKRFRDGIRARRPRRRVSQEDRRHHLRTSTVADGLVLAVAEARQGRRNGTLIVAAESDKDGRMRRYLVAMAPAVHLSEQ